MAKVHIMHYLNQFFAGKGGEEKADVALGSLEGVVGPGKRLQELLKASAEIVVTAYCGDDYFPEHQNKVLASIQRIAKDHGIEIVVAGPAFFAGRYSFACVEVCHSLSTSLDLYGVTGMSINNPGVVGYKRYKDRKVFAFPTRENVVGMEEALAKMAGCVSKLAAGKAMGPASEEGYIPRGLRVLQAVSNSAVDRAVDMWLDKVAGRSFATEIPVETQEETPIAPRIVNLKDARIAIASTAGVHPEGNPYGARSIKNDVWAKYPVGKLNSMTESKWMMIHGGINTTFMQNNPNFGAPLDACREMEREGVFAKLSPNFYSTTGVIGAIEDMEVIGREMVRDMKAEGVDAALLVST